MTIPKGHRGRTLAANVETVGWAAMKRAGGGSYTWVHARRCTDCGGWVDSDDRHLPRWAHPSLIVDLHKRGEALYLAEAG